MTTLKTKVIRTNLCKKGFRESEGDHHFLQLYNNDKKTAIHTKISHGKNEIDDTLIGLMARKVKLSKNDFVNYAKCNMTEDEYLKKVNKYL